MRQRLSWDQEKVAETIKKADPYTMNQDRKNPPVQKYDIGGPSAFAEDPDLRTPWKTEGRLETGHPAPAREAVKSARQLEDKALKCITIAQRVLPGASDDLIESQATDFMFLPERAILATLERQSKLAEILAQEEEEEKEEEKEAAKKPEEEEEEKEAAKKPEEEEEEKEAAKKPEKEEKEKSAKEEKEVAKKPEEEEKEKSAEDEKEVAKKPEEEEKEKSAEDEKEIAKKPEEEKKEKSAEEDIDLLDSIFANEEKTGAKKLSGIVKQASNVNNLEDLWSAPPDVSEAFK